MIMLISPAAEATESPLAQVNRYPPLHTAIRESHAVDG
jgi:hypothetical protein